MAFSKNEKKVLGVVAAVGIFLWLKKKQADAAASGLEDRSLLQTAGDQIARVTDKVTGLFGEKKLRSILPFMERASKATGVPLSWLAAIARKETGFEFRFANVTAGDLKRGGSWGAFQMSLETARGLGYKGPAPDIKLVKWDRSIGGNVYTGPITDLMDPEVNIMLAAQFIAQAKKRGLSIADAASVYNSGRTRAQLKAAIDKASGNVKKVLLESYNNYSPVVARYQSEYASLDA